MEIAVIYLLLAVSGIGLRAILSRSPRWARGLAPAAACVALIAVAVPCALFSAPLDEAGKIALVVVTLSAATLAGWPVTEATLYLALKVPMRDPVVELPAMGWVGLVERFGFTLALILGFPEVAALLVGVKALGSYATRNEQPNTTSAARVLGTLSSVTWALVVVTVYLAATR